MGFGAPQNWDLYGMIKQIIVEETIYYRHYLGRVVDVNDQLRKGRVQVAIDELGFDDNSKALWCWPRQGNAMSLPKMNTWVEVYFMNADPAQPVYLFPAVEMQNMVPSKFDGLAKTHLLFQDPDKPTNYIKFDSSQGLYDMFGKLKVDVTGGNINMLNATKKFVLGDDLDTWITSTLKIWTDTHVHTSAAPGSPTTVATTQLTAPTNYLSDNIKGS